MWKTARLLAALLALTIMAPVAGPAAAAEDGSRRILLSGALAEGQGGSVTVRDIEEIGANEFTLFNPYDQREERYTGVFISDLVKKLGADGVQSITLTAIDDYTIEFTREEWGSLRIVLSTRVNGEYTGFDKKGPIRVVYPDYDPSKLEYQETLPKWIWMITRIEFNE